MLGAPQKEMIHFKVFILIKKLEHSSYRCIQPVIHLTVLCYRIPKHSYPGQIRWPWNGCHMPPGIPKRNFSKLCLNTTLFLNVASEKWWQNLCVYWGEPGSLHTVSCQYPARANILAEASMQINSQERIVGPTNFTFPWKQRKHRICLLQPSLSCSLFTKFPMWDSKVK